MKSGQTIPTGSPRLLFQGDHFLSQGPLVVLFICSKKLGKTEKSIYISTDPTKKQYINEAEDTSVFFLWVENNERWLDRHNKFYCVVSAVGLYPLFVSEETAQTIEYPSCRLSILANHAPRKRRDLQI
jgi:hypothetical protein